MSYLPSTTVVDFSINTTKHIGEILLGLGFGLGLGLRLRLGLVLVHHLEAVVHCVGLSIENRHRVYMILHDRTLHWQSDATKCRSHA